MSHSRSSIDCSPPISPTHRILQARILQWTAIAPGDLSDPEIKRGFLALQADSLPSKPSGKYCRLFSTILGLCLLDNSSTFPLIVAIQKNVSRYCQMSLGGNTHTCWRTATRSWLSGKCPTCSVNLRLPNDIAWRRDCA